MMVGPSLGKPANAGAVTNRSSSSKPRPGRAVFRKAAHLYPALWSSGWIIEGVGCELVASGSLWQLLQAEFPSRGSYVRAPGIGVRGTALLPARQRHLPVRDRR